MYWSSAAHCEVMSELTVSVLFSLLGRLFDLLVYPVIGALSFTVLLVILLGTMCLRK